LTVPTKTGREEATSDRIIAFNGLPFRIFATSPDMRRVTSEISIYK